MLFFSFRKLSFVQVLQYIVPEGTYSAIYKFSSSSQNIQKNFKFAKENITFSLSFFFLFSHYQTKVIGKNIYTKAV